MSKFLCKCGNTIRISGAIPNPAEYLYISDTEFDKYWEAKIDTEALYATMKSALECEKCGRLWVYTNGFENPPKLYQPEEY